MTTVKLAWDTTPSEAFKLTACVRRVRHMPPQWEAAQNLGMAQACAWLVKTSKQFNGRDGAAIDFFSAARKKPTMTTVKPATLHIINHDHSIRPPACFQAGGITHATKNFGMRQAFACPFHGRAPTVMQRMEKPVQDSSPAGQRLCGHGHQRLQRRGDSRHRPPPRQVRSA